jgi:hypothetical protein
MKKKPMKKREDQKERRMEDSDQKKINKRDKKGY